MVIRMIHWLDTSDDEMLTVVEDDEKGNEKVVSNMETVFILCGRCVKKIHPGQFENNVFICNYQGSDFMDWFRKEHGRQILKDETEELICRGCEQAFLSNVKDNIKFCSHCGKRYYR